MRKLTRPFGSGTEVVEIAPNLESASGREVPDGDPELGDVWQAPREEALLEDLRGLQRRLIALGIVDHCRDMPRESLRESHVSRP